MDRRSSSDDRTSRHVPNPNVFDDEYALDPTEDDFMPAVSDGFRPANASEELAGDRQDHDRDEPPPRPSISTSKSADSADLRRIASRNSTMKISGAMDPASHDTRVPNAHTRAPSSQTAAQHRMSISSTGSFATMARSESPFGAGPSHPYGMYPQNTVARTSSVTTSSTQRQPHRSMSLHRPAHPYGMYTQNVVEDEVEPAIPAVQTAIPVGFPGINTGFHRQIGPDGEEQDIIGPDGHTEQLPPYSRYPEEGPTKAAMAAEASATPVTATPVLAPLNTSDETLIPPQPQQSQPPSPDTHARAVPLTTVASTTSSEPSLSEKNDGAVAAGGWRKKRLWGKVPMGVVVILLVLVLVFAIILGAAIGTFVAKQNQKDHSPPKKNKGDNDPAAQETGASTGTLFDATPMATPTSLSVLPTGVFALPLGIAQESNPGCLPQANQVSAWSCKMGFAPLILTINSTASSTSDASVSGFVKADTGPSYGIQPPMLPPIQLELVLDLDYPAYGPAWHFQALYDKLVVLTSDEFAAGAGLRRRDQGKPSFRQRFQVLPGDTPWYCYWNQTFIEGYIYVNDNSSAATRTASSSWPTSEPSSTSSGFGASSTTPSPTTTPMALHRRGDTDYPHYAAYPRIVKIEERRLPGAPQPYCMKMQLLDNNAIVPATNSNGQNIVVQLQEQDPTIAQFLSAGNPAPAISTNSPSGNTTRRGLRKRDDPALACHCQWMFQ